MKEDITIHPRDIIMIITPCDKQLQVNKFNNIEEMDTFLKRHKLSNLMQEEIKNLKALYLLKIFNLKFNTPPVRKPYSSFCKVCQRHKEEKKIKYAKKEYNVGGSIYQLIKLSM